MTPCASSAPPLAGICTICVPVSAMNISIGTWLTAPIPWLPRFHLPGLARISATIYRIVFARISRPTTMIEGPASVCTASTTSRGVT